MAQAQASSCRAQPNVVTQERNFRRRSLLADSGFTSMSGLDTAAYALAAGRVGRRRHRNILGVIPMCIEGKGELD